MKIAALLIRTLLGLAFILFGINAFTGFMNPKEMPPMPELAMKFSDALMGSAYMRGVGAFEIAGGLLLLTGRFAPLGLTLLGPVLVNIFFFHAFLNPTGWQPGALCAAFWLFLLYYYRRSFAGLVGPVSDQPVN